MCKLWVALAFCVNTQSVPGPVSPPAEHGGVSPGSSPSSSPSVQWCHRDSENTTPHKVRTARQNSLKINKYVAITAFWSWTIFWLRAKEPFAHIYLLNVLLMCRTLLNLLFEAVFRTAIHVVFFLFISQYCQPGMHLVRAMVKMCNAPWKRQNRFSKTCFIV